MPGGAVWPGALAAQRSDPAGAVEVSSADSVAVPSSGGSDEPDARGVPDAEIRSRAVEARSPPTSPSSLPALTAAWSVTVPPCFDVR